MGAPLTDDEKRKRFLDKNITLLEIPKHMNSKCQVECNVCHYQWKTSLNSIRLCVKGCPKCTNCAVLTIEDAIVIAQSNGGTCLSPEYVNKNEPLEWQCANGHTFLMPLGRARHQGSWCPHCARVARKTIEDCHNTALSRSGKCLETAYINSKSPMQWQCSCGYIWTSNYHDICGGHWCPKCGDAIKKSLACCCSMAVSQGGKCLSTEYVNNKTPLEWMCARGHVFQSPWMYVQAGHWCPYCLNKTENLVRRSFEKFFGVLFNTARPKWLCRLTLDGYNEEKRIAFEYDGIWHFQKHYAARDDIDTLGLYQERDRRKTELCALNNVTLIRISYKELPAYPTPLLIDEYVFNKLKLLGFI